MSNEEDVQNRAIRNSHKPSWMLTTWYFNSKNYPCSWILKWTNKLVLIIIACYSMWWESCLVVLHKEIVHILVKLLVVFLHADQTLNKETGERKDEQVISMITQTDGRKGRQTDRQTGRKTGRQTDRQTDSLAEGWMDEAWWALF